MQCAKCPWKKGVNPHAIPAGYSVEKHRALSCTIREGVESLMGPRQIMACHETPPGAEEPCVGWLVHQLGPGNNIGIRLAVSCGQIDGDVRTIGPQHATFQATLPRASVRGR